ncbi:hypothetical protein B23_3366 [Geobacillus thermoleovorans B23]|nr:hypothetical protein B23_3366 [Geobacillus thermoleovorans B23]
MSCDMTRKKTFQNCFKFERQFACHFNLSTS